MAITVPPVRGPGDLGHVDDSNIVRQALLDLDAADAAIVQAAGNLLTANQASLEDGNTTGWAAYGANCTIAASTTQKAEGSYSLAVTATSNALVGADMATPYAPVVAGRVYTLEFWVYSAAARVVTPYIQWLTSTPSFISQSSGTAVTTSAAWTRVTVSAVAPATAALAAPLVYISSAQTGEVFYIDKIGLWEGYGGTWAMPGQPIQGIGERWDAAGVWMWDTFENRETLVVARSALPPRATALPAGGQ